MSASIKTVYAGARAEIVEKKSRFIAEIAYVETEEEAMAFLEAIRKKYWNARHHCWAYVLGERGENLRCSDDGEPQGTAGRPMLEVLTGGGITNCLAVVSRYFGGVLLGTGGLVRAYSQAVKAGLEASSLIERKFGKRVVIRTDYNGIGKIQYLLAQRGVLTEEAIYEANVTLKILLPMEEIASLLAEIREATNGKSLLQEEEDVYFAVLDGSILTGEKLHI